MNKIALFPKFGILLGVWASVFFLFSCGKIKKDESRLNTTVQDSGQCDTINPTDATGDPDKDGTSCKIFKLSVRHTESGPNYGHFMHNDGSFRLKYIGDEDISSIGTSLSVASSFIGSKDLTCGSGAAPQCIIDDDNKEIIFYPSRLYDGTSEMQKLVSHKHTLSIPVVTTSGGVSKSINIYMQFPMLIAQEIKQVGVQLEYSLKGFDRSISNKLYQKADLQIISKFSGDNVNNYNFGGMYNHTEWYPTGKGLYSQVNNLAAWDNAPVTPNVSPAQIKKSFNISDILINLAKNNTLHSSSSSDSSEEKKRKKIEIVCNATATYSNDVRLSVVSQMSRMIGVHADSNGGSSCPAFTNGPPCPDWINTDGPVSRGGYFYLKRDRDGTIFGTACAALTAMPANEF